MDEIFEEKINRLLNTIAIERNFKNYKIEVSNQLEKGNNYMGQLVSVVIQDSKKTLNLMVKLASKSDKFRESSPVVPCYEIEILMYGTILPFFNNFELEKNKESSSKLAECYGFCTEHKNECLILENLQYRGFTMMDKKRDLDKHHAELVMKELGKFHAVSFAVKDQDPNTFKKFRESLIKDPYNLMVRTGGLFEVLQGRIEAVQKMVELKNYEKLRKPLAKLHENLRDFMFGLVDCYDDRYSVMIHGDDWTPNIMFKYKDNSDQKRPIDIKWIDFQLSRLASPVIDLSYFLYGCTDKDVLDNLTDYLKLYHNSFCNHLQNLGTERTKAMSFGTLEKIWKKLGKYGVIMGMCLIFARLTQSDEAVDPAEFLENGDNNLANIFNYELRDSENYYRKVMDLLNHALDYGVLE